MQPVEELFLLGIVAAQAVEKEAAEWLVQTMRVRRQPGHPILAVKPHGDRRDRPKLLEGLGRHLQHGLQSFRIVRAGHDQIIAIGDHGHRIAMELELLDQIRRQDPRGIVVVARGRKIDALARLRADEFGRQGSQVPAGDFQGLVERQPPGIEIGLGNRPHGIRQIVDQGHAEVFAQRHVGPTDRRAAFDHAAKLVQLEMRARADDRQQVGHDVLEILGHVAEHAEPVPHPVPQDAVAFFRVGRTVLPVGVAEHEGRGTLAFAAEAEFLGLVGDRTLLARLLDAVDHELGKIVFAGFGHGKGMVNDNAERSRRSIPSGSMTGKKDRLGVRGLPGRRIWSAGIHSRFQLPRATAVLSWSDDLRSSFRKRSALASISRVIGGKPLRGKELKRE